MKLLLIILASVLGLTALAEIGLRLTKGLGNPPLYIPDDNIGYLLAPNQTLRRSGNSIEINQYSMRDGEIKRKKDRGIERIFLLGDSVVFGSWWTNQNDILANLLVEQLRKSGNKSWEVLNAATNSWGPRNELAYLQQYSLFDADTLVLIINTDDLYATKPTSLVVGRSYSYPDKAPALALVELYQFYLASPPQIPELEELRNQKEQNLTENLAAIQKIKEIAAESNAKFVLVLTPLLSELQKGSTEEEARARDMLQQLVKKEEIHYQDFLQIWSDFPQPEFLYRDRIHPSPQGNTKIIEQLAEIFTSQQ